MSNLSELLPAGAGAKSASFVASGTLGSGVTVGLNSDGTVSAISATATPNSVGTLALYNTGISSDTTATYDSTNNKIVVAYRDGGNSQYGTAVVGTVSGTSISFGTPVVYGSGTTYYNSAVFDSTNNKIVIAFQGTSGQNGAAIVGTISGTSISFGTAAYFESQQSYFISAAYDTNAQKVVISYADSGNSFYGTAVVGTVSGTSISFGSLTVFANAGMNGPTYALYDPTTTKIVIAYVDAGSASSFDGTAIVGTVSGTSISFGSPTVFENSAITEPAMAYDTVNQKVVIVYRNTANSNHGTAVIGTVSGTGISFGTPVVFNPATSEQPTVAYDSNAEKMVIAYTNAAISNKGSAIVGTVSGTSISFGTALNFTTANAASIIATYDATAEKVVMAWRGASNAGSSVVFTVGGGNFTSFIGITDQAIADTATGAVIVQGGVSEKLSGLTVGADYYVQDDGSLASPTAPSPYVIDGATFIQSFSVSAQDSSPHGIAFNTDGTKMFFVGITNDNVYEYDLSTGFDISTSVYSQTFSVASQDSFPRGLAFNSDGTKMFVTGDINDNVFEYTLSTGFDISTASYSQSFSVSAQDTTTQGIAFNTDGTKMYIVGQVSDAVYEYTLSTGFNISTASYSQSFSVASQDTSPNGIAFSSDGTKMFITGNAGDDVNRYLLSTAFDVSTASFSDNFSVAPQDSQPQGVAFSADGTKMFVMGSANDSLYEYSTGGGPISSVPAGRALSTTSILLEG